MTDTVAVVVCAFTERRWDDLRAACASLIRQTRPADEIVVVIDHNDALLARADAELAGVRVVASRNVPGLSGARNTGVWASSSDIVLFLDDDAVAAPDWIERMVHPFADPRVAGVAGRVEANWDEPGRPAWFPEPFLWTVGCSYQGLPAAGADVRNPIGAAMAFRRRAFERAGGFAAAIGRVGDLPVGCEETEFAIRLRQADPAAAIVQAPAARVAHRVPPERGRLAYFLRRCYHEGRSKRAVARLVGAKDSLSSERSHATRVLPAEVAAGLARSARTGRADGLLTAAAVVAGLAAAVAGYLHPAGR